MDTNRGLGGERKTKLDTRLLILAFLLNHSSVVALDTIGAFGCLLGVHWTSNSSNKEVTCENRHQ